MKLSPCIEWLFADETDDVVERIKLAADCGLDGVEFHQWQNKPAQKIAKVLNDTGLKLTSHIVEPRRSLVDPAEHDEFILAVRNSLKAAKTLNCPFLIVASGFTREGVSREEHHETAASILRKAAAMAENEGKTLVLEPLNDKVDHPGMYLCSVSEALDIVDEVASPGLRLVYDFYHSIVMGDDPTTVLNGRMDRVAHVQIADMPGRGAPGTGGIDWRKVKQSLNEGGYNGFIGLEFKLNDLSTREAIRKTREALEI